MEKEEVRSALQEYAEKRLNASAYEDCTHKFDLWECGKCGGISFVATIERHESDVPGDFHGILRTSCPCGSAEVKLNVLAEGAVGVKAIGKPRCACGRDTFHIGICERWENWSFFDEGTVVAMCGACGAMVDLVDTD